MNGRTLGMKALDSHRFNELPLEERLTLLREHGETTEYTYNCDNYRDKLFFFLGGYVLVRFDLVAVKFLDARAHSAYDEAVYEWLSIVDLPEFPGIRYWFDDLDHDGDEHGDE